MEGEEEEEEGDEEEEEGEERRRSAANSPPPRGLRGAGRPDWPSCGEYRRGNMGLAKRDRSIWPPLTRARYT